MNGKQHFSMHPALHEPKYPGLHSGSEGMRRVCLPAPQVRSGRGVRGGEEYHTGNVCKVDLTGLCSLSALSPSLPVSPLSLSTLRPPLPSPAPLLTHLPSHPHVYSSNALPFILIFMTCALRRVLSSPQRCSPLENVF